jgi:hypothetical protein
MTTDRTRRIPRQMMSGERNGARPRQMMERINTVGMAMSKSRIAFCVFMARPLSENHFLLQKWCIEVVYAEICLYPILLVKHCGNARFPSILSCVVLWVLEAVQDRCKHRSYRCLHLSWTSLEHWDLHYCFLAPDHTSIFHGSLNSQRFTQHAQPPIDTTLDGSEGAMKLVGNRLIVILLKKA